MKIATDISTDDWDRIIEGLIEEGWTISMKYNEFDARIDFDFIELKKGEEIVLCGWDNWVEGEIKASNGRLSYIENKFGVDFSFGKPVNLKLNVIQLTKAQILFKRSFTADVNEGGAKVKVVNEENELDSVLFRLYNSEGERLLRKELVNEPPIGGRNFQELLQILIEVELVEYDHSDEAYYLTHEGYQRVEALQDQLNDDQINKPKKQTNYFLIFLILVLLTGIYNVIFGVKSRPSPKDVLNEEVIDMIHDDIKEKVDSLMKSGTIKYEDE